MDGRLTVTYHAPRVMLAVSMILVTVSFCGLQQTPASAANATSTSTTSLQKKHADRLKAMDSAGHSRMRTSSVGSKSSITQRTVVDFTTADEQNRLKNQLSSPFSRQDIFYSGSVTSLREYKTSPDMATYIKVVSPSAAEMAFVDHFKRGRL